MVDAFDSRARSIEYLERFAIDHLLLCRSLVQSLSVSYECKNGVHENMRIEYKAPSNQSIEEYARKVCEGLADRRQNANLIQPEVITGFANFLKLALRVTAEHRSKTHEEQKPE